uniref:Uncharacterized protein n=1 Tax=Candidatus Kentrum sp. LFY TaxID=2126342 RepID=A0A450UXX5_9GAMM|nr:MAG: hypothetical protein BECKLFY1418B_GA0070995_11008 [Candidatus Kentron sp. LFY]VFK23429.1 MAG: hypothetical protein BECKLFY1418C_GA0070996_11425 [Candidatus Kentron sp. LFY]
MELNSTKKWKLEVSNYGRDRIVITIAGNWRALLKRIKLIKKLRLGSFKNFLISKIVT